jgi:hypothetical protein
MNQYTELFYYLKELLEQDDFVNSIRQGSFDQLDIEKANVYPLAHIDVLSANLDNNVITFNVVIACVAQRDKVNEIKEDKFWRQDNEVDNFNETLAILNRLWLKLYTDLEQRDITASLNVPLSKIDFEYTNTLDGWLLDFNIQVPNTTLNLCQ